MKLALILVTFLTMVWTLFRLALIGVVFYSLYYVYTYGLEALFVSIMKGF